MELIGLKTAEALSILKARNVNNIIIKKLCGKCAVEADSEIVVKAEETADGYILYTAEFLTGI